jgi:hypothetical protein
VGSESLEIFGEFILLGGDTFLLLKTHVVVMGSRNKCVGMFLNYLVNLISNDRKVSLRRLGTPI